MAINRDDDSKAAASSTEFASSKEEYFQGGVYDILAGEEDEIQIFKAHEATLSKSPVLSRMMERNWKETSLRQLKLPFIEPCVIFAYLNWLYREEYAYDSAILSFYKRKAKHSSEHVNFVRFHLKVAELADFLQLIDLQKQACERIVTCRCNAADLLDALRYLYEKDIDIKLVEAIYRRVYHELDSILKSPELYKLLCEEGRTSAAIVAIIARTKLESNELLAHIHPDFDLDELPGVYQSRW